MLVSIAKATKKPKFLTQHCKTSISTQMRRQQQIQQFINLNSINTSACKFSQQSKTCFVSTRASIQTAKCDSSTKTILFFTLEIIRRSLPPFRDVTTTRSNRPIRRHVVVTPHYCNQSITELSMVSTSRVFISSLFFVLGVNSL